MIRIVCRACGVPFWRHGAAESSHEYVSLDDAQTCICCRFDLDPETLQPRRRGTWQPGEDVRGVVLGVPYDY